jgi:hypothetical protein
MRVQLSIRGRKRNQNEPGVERTRYRCYNQERSARVDNEPYHSVGNPAPIGSEVKDPRSQRWSGFDCGQVAQVVERSPEKAGVGGSTPSLATIFSIT